MANNNRNQSIELLRILMMTLIVFGHILLFGFEGSNSTCRDMPLVKLLQPLYLYHVDTFIFISGYYGIKFNGGGKFLLLIAKMIIYSAIAIIITGVFFNPEVLSASTLIKNIYPVSTCDWWFMAQYMYLMLMAPILNTGMERLTRRQSSILLIMMYIASFRTFFCLLVFIYLLGRHLRRFPVGWFERHSGKIFLLTTTLFFVLNIMCLNIGIHCQRMYDYISPFNVVAAAALFYTFKKRQVSWKGFGYIGSGTLAAYLITDHELLRPFFTTNIVQALHGHVMLCLFAATAVVIVCSLIDKATTAIISKSFNSICRARRGE